MIALSASIACAASCAKDARPSEPEAGSGGAAGGGGSSGEPCEVTGLAAGNTTRMLSYGGVNRRYLVHAPPSYDGTTLVPLVIDLHGWTYTDADQAGESGWREKSDEEGFIVVHPNGLDTSWNGGALCCGSSQENGVDDEGFIRALVTQLSREACVDPKRVYATGLSNGGALSYALACHSADVFAAVAPVSMGNGTTPCTPSRPISMIMFRGTGDDLVPYSNGTTYPSAADDLAEWKSLDSCTGTPTKVSRVCDRYSACAGNSEVMLCTIPDGEHVLYDDAATAGASVPDVAWAAFERHTLP